MPNKKAKQRKWDKKKRRDDIKKYKKLKRKRNKSDTND